MSYYEHFNVEVDAPQNQHSAHFDDLADALLYFLEQRTYDARVKLIFTGGEYEEE